LQATAAEVKMAGNPAQFNKSKKKKEKQT